MTIRGSLSCRCQSFTKGVCLCLFCYKVKKRCLVLFFLQVLLTLQSSLESQTQQARNDGIMKASPCLFSVLSLFCYLLEAVTGQNDLIHREPAAAWRKERIKFKHTPKSIRNRSKRGQWIAYGLKTGLVLNYCRIKQHSSD